MVNIENRFFLRVKSFIRKSLPSTIEPILKIAARTVFFRKERHYIFKYQKENKCSSRSLVLLSQPRGGTQVCEQIVSRLFSLIKGETLHIGKFLFWYDNQRVSYLRDEQWANENLLSQGYFYGNFGYYNEVSKLPKLKYLVMCRDPRDVLISHYYSIRDAHLLNSEKMRKVSQKAQEMTLDEYVLSREPIEDVKKYLHQAIQMRKSDHEYLFFRYEDMMEDPYNFLSKVAKFIGVEITEEMSRNLVEEYKLSSITRDEELNTRHRRAGYWGQFENKLMKSTQHALWKEFEDELIVLGYKKSSNGL